MWCVTQQKVFSIYENPNSTSKHSRSEDFDEIPLLEECWMISRDMLCDDKHRLCSNAFVNANDEHESKNAFSLHFVRRDPSFHAKNSLNIIRLWRDVCRFGLQMDLLQLSPVSRRARCACCHAPRPPLRKIYTIQPTLYWQKFSGEALKASKKLSCNNASHISSSWSVSRIPSTQGYFKK